MFTGYTLQFELFLNHLLLVTDVDCRIMKKVNLVRYLLSIQFLV
jgi:hypothetical protein